MQDPFADFQSGLTAPATMLFPIAANDAADLGTFVRGLTVATSGLVRVTTVEDTQAVIFITAGAPFPVRVKKVWATGTDATGIVGLC